MPTGSPVMRPTLSRHLPVEPVVASKSYGDVFDAPQTSWSHSGMSIETSIASIVEGETGQPYPYRRVELVEPDWTRFPGWKDVTREEWESAQWQRSHCVKNLRQLRELLGDLVDERFYADLERDQTERATMSMLVPPQMMNTMALYDEPAGAGSLTESFYADPVRRYMLPVFSDRRTDWPSHP